MWKPVFRKQMFLWILCLAIAGCQSKAQPLSSSKTIYLAIEANTPEEKLLGQDVLHEVSRDLRSANNYAIVDYMKGTQVINLFSDEASPLGIREAMNALSENPSDGMAIIKALDRAVKLGQHKKVTAIVVTSGTLDSHLLAWMSKLMEKLPPTTRLYFVGLEPDNRLPMSSAFAAVRDRVKFAVLDEEWIAVIKHL